MDEIKNERGVVAEEQILKDNYIKKRNSNLRSILFLLAFINIYLPIFVLSIYSRHRADDFFGFLFPIYTIPYSIIMIFIYKKIFAKVKSLTIGFLMCLLVSLVIWYLIALAGF